MQPLHPPHQATHPTSPCRESPSPPRGWSPTPTACSRRRARSGTRRPTLRAFPFFEELEPLFFVVYRMSVERTRGSMPVREMEGNRRRKRRENERESASFFLFLLPIVAALDRFLLLLLRPHLYPTSSSTSSLLKKINIKTPTTATTPTPTSSSPRATTPSAPSPTLSSRAAASSTPRPSASPCSSLSSR